MMKLPSLIHVEAELAKRGLDEKAIPTEGSADLPPAIEMADRLEPRMRRQFMQAIQAAKGRIPLQELEQALRTGNLARIFETLRLAELEGALKLGTTETLQRGYLAGAQVAANKLRQAGIRVRFDVMDPHAVAWAESRSSKLITEIMQVQRIAVQEVVADAFRTGRTVDQVARDLRGFIGLHSRQVRASEKLRAKLETQGLDPAKIDRRIERYETGLLNQRARTIARTEMVQSAHFGQQGQWDQAAADGLFNKQTTRKVWITTVDDLTDAEICLPMEGETVKYGEPWQLPNGEMVQAPGQSHPNCRCDEALIFDE